MRVLALLPLVLLVGCQKSESPSPQPRQYATIDSATAATITGVVSFTGTAPPPQKLDMSQDPACTLGAKAENFSEAYEVKQGKLANVYVYVKEGLGEKVFAPPTEPAVLDQRGCRYTPHVMGIVAGQKLRVLNSDPALHNVHPSPQHNDEWNISQQPHGEPIEKTFDRAELMMPIKCNQHPWMKMYLNVAMHPFFAVTKDDGGFKLSGLPPGEYTIAAVHERMGEKTRRTSIRAKEAKPIAFEFAQDDVK